MRTSSFHERARERQLAALVTELSDVKVDDEGCQQDQTTDQYLLEPVLLSMVEAVVDHTQHWKADDCIANAAASAKQAGDAHQKSAISPNKKVSN
jgi:hypothetical protein